MARWVLAAVLVCSAVDAAADQPPGEAQSGSVPLSGAETVPPPAREASGHEIASRQDAACANTIASRVQSYYDSIVDFSADFEQTTQSSLFGDAGLPTADVARGRVVLAKPGKMRWTYTDPAPSVVVSDGTTLWLYSPGLAEAQRLPMTDGFPTGAGLSFLLGEGNLLETFVVSAADCNAEPRIELTLTPREVANYEQLSLTVSVATGEILATGVLDLFGNETSIRFDNVEWNQAPAASVFQFVPGPGVSVVDLGGP